MKLKSTAYMLVKSVIFLVNINTFIYPVECQGLFGGLINLNGGNRGGQTNGRIGGGGGGSGGNRSPGLNLNLSPLLPINLNINLGPNNRNQQHKNEPTNPCNGPKCQNGNYEVENHPLKKYGIVWNNVQETISNSSGVLVPTQGAQSRFLIFNENLPDKPYGNCKTPLNEAGNCRHLEYCVQDTFKNDYLAFIQYSCTIQNMYIGVCCPDPSLEIPSSESPKPKPRPPVAPNKPKKNPNRPNRPNNGSKRPGGTKKPKPSPIESDFDPGVLDQDPYRCGFSEKQITRVVGGRKADPKAWPWMAALLRADSQSDDKRSGQYCGGVLISEFHVMTASHCVDGFKPSEIKIRLGEYNFTGTSDKRRDFDVESIKVHEEYNRYSYKNDIAIVRLAQSAFYSNEIRIICLPKPTRNPTFTNEIGIVTGWGTIYYGGPTSESLMEVLVPIWKQEDCKAAYTTQPIEETNICAGVRTGSRDSCQGDSGGPLQLEIEGRWAVVGIVSWGIRCAEPGYPGVYTRVTKFMDWIQKNI